ncbi:hypothetical protein OT109_07710 [Phycisphaeraceae bacterium D3-23]
MLNRICRPMLWACALCGVAGLVWVGQSATAQDSGGAGSAPAAAEPPPIELDLQEIIDSSGNSGRAARFDDAVWDIRAESSRKTVLIPIRVTPGAAEYELSRPSIGLRAARFVGWYIAPLENNRNNSAAGESFRVGDGFDLEGLLLGEDSDETQSDRGRGELGDQLDALDAATDGSDFEPVPDNAPRLARKITIHPDATVGWEMDRAFTGATLRSVGQNNLYGYKLDPEALRDAQPERPEQLTRNANESSRDYANRRREQQETFRADSNDYRELRDAVRELPEDFREPNAGVVYAVYDAPLSDDWSYTGDDPLPWQIDQEDLDAIASLAGNRSSGSGNGLDARLLETVQTLSRLANSGGVMDQRAIALAAYQGRLADVVVRNGKGYELLETLASSRDDQTRLVALASIARVQPPTRASVQLLAEAARDATGDLAQTLQLASMRSSFRIEAGDGGNTDFLVTQVNNALADRDGPPAVQVLEEAIDALAVSSSPSQSGRSGQIGLGNPGRNGNPGGADNDADDALTALIHQTEFEQIRIDQFEAVIAMIIRRSPDSELAAGWLDVQLLRSPDTDLTDQALVLLSQADSTSTVIAPLTGELRSLVFGASPAADGGDGPAIVLDGVIPLTSEDHGLVIALTSAHPERRALAWEVLRHFELTGSGSAQDDTARKTFDRIVTIGLDVQSHPRTPVSLVDFIDNQTDSTLAPHARAKMLELIVTEGIDAAAASRAARKIVGSGHDYRDALTALDPIDRATCVMQVYAMLNGQPPAVVGLVGDVGQDALVRWLAESWQRGEVPDAHAWADAVGDYNALLRLAGSNEPVVAAGAAAAIVLRAGGTPEQQQQFIDKVAALANPSPATVESAWEPIRRDIFAAHLADAAGAYRIVLSVYDAQEGTGVAPPARNGGGRGVQPRDGGRDPRGPQSPGRLVEPGLTPRGPGDLGQPTTPANPGATRAADPSATYDLGLVQMQIDGDDITLSVETLVMHLAEERLALHIDAVSALAGFEAPGLDDLPLSQLDEGLDLLPEGEDAWVGSLELPDGRVLEVAFERER